MNWYTRITVTLGEISNFLQYFEAELENAKKEVKVYGNVEKNIAAIPVLLNTDSISYKK